MAASKAEKKHFSPFGIEESTLKLAEVDGICVARRLL
jgi:hypothetical protein